MSKTGGTVFRKLKKIHMVGIGGIGMSGIAEVLKNMGYDVSGSDIRKTEITERLIRLGINVVYEHNPKNVEGKDIVVVSTAIPENNPELLRARELRIPIMHRAEVLSDLMRAKFGIAVTGSHGKTTTASLIGEILGHAGFDPTLIIGGRLKSIGTNARLGESLFMVAEVDESDGTFLKVSSTINVLTNVDREHLDRYGDFRSLIEAVSSFMNQIPFWGLNIICMEDRGAMEVYRNVKKRTVTYGFSTQADVRAEKISFVREGYEFEVRKGETFIGKFYIPLAGKHNVLNALASICVGIELEIPYKEMRDALSGFMGIERRMELKGVRNGIFYYDDYGHHPSEIMCTITAIREKVGGAPLHVIFQPHRYSRTKLLLEEFAKCFYEADTVIVIDIYPAGEKPIEGVSSVALVEKLKEFGHKGAYYGESPEKVLSILRERVNTGDVVLTLGAGDVYKYHEVLKNGL